MKKKPFEKKLVLNKKTIAHLGNNEQDTAKGGAPTGSCQSHCWCTLTDQMCGATCPPMETCPYTGKPLCLQCGDDD
jgi:hypothetical protein